MSLLLLFGGGGAPAGTVILPTLGDLATINAPAVDPFRRIEFDTLGDQLTLNAPAVTSPYTVPLPTFGNLVTLNAPNVFLFRGIALPSIGGGPVAGGLHIANVVPPEPPPTPGEPIARNPTPLDPRIVVRVCDPSDPLTVLETLDEAKAKKWREIVSAHGTGSCVLQNDDADLAATLGGRLLRFELDGRAVFLASIEKRSQVVISPAEGPAEATEVGGRGIMALWEDAVVYPEAGATGRPFADQRVMNWTSADFDDSGWSVIVNGPTIGQAHANDPGIAVGFPDGLARVIWAWGPDGASGAGAGGAPVGVAYFRKKVTVTTEGWFRFFITADDGATVVIDGVQLYQEARLWFHLETQSVDVYLSAGEHQLAIRGENLDNENPDPMTNSAWVLMSAMAITEDGELGDVLVRTDTTWVGVAYPPKPPGMTVGRVVRVLLEEAQARGALLGWELAFTDTSDSNGKPWDDDPELAFQIGHDLYSVLQQLAESYVELDTAPAQLVLYAYADGFGQVTSVAYTEASNILALSHEASS